MPDELDTDRARKMFSNVEWIEKDGDRYTWTGSMALFGFFVDYSSKILGIRIGPKKRIPWKQYQLAFGMTDANIRTAQQIVHGYTKGIQQKPKDSRDVIIACNKKT